MTALIFRKLLNNRWMFICLLIGFIIIAAVVSCIPIYSTGILQRMLKVDLQQFQSDKNIYPGNYTITVDYLASTFRTEYSVDAMDEFITDSINRIGVPTISQVNRLSTTQLGTWRSDMLDASPLYMNITAMSGLKDKVTITHGRAAENGLFEDTDGIPYYEVIVNKTTMKTMSLSMGQKWVLAFAAGNAAYDENLRIPVKIVGVFEPVDSNDTFWFMNESTYSTCFFMDYDQLKSLLTENENYSGYLNQSVWYYAFDYNQYDVAKIKSVLAAMNEQKEQYSSLGASCSIEIPAIGTLEEYVAREATLNILLWILIIPLLVMLSFYILMVSRLKLENEANEIAVLKSRGASTLQIFGGYILEWAFLSGVALLAGPPLGFLLCRILGSSNGFLEFVNRTALPLKLTPLSYLYVILAMLLFAVSMLIPAYSASKITIVEYKQKAARKKKTPLWQLLGVDFILIAVAMYGYWRYNEISSNLTSGNASMASTGIDPLTFALSSLFLLGCGLLFLRFYPLIIRFIFFLGRKFWTPVLYSSFIRVSRSKGKEIFVMLFIIYSISTGLFSANAARTLNVNNETRILYSEGADGVVKINWAGYDWNKGETATTDTTKVVGGKFKFQDLNAFRSIDGIEAATTVYFPGNHSYNILGVSGINLTVMGIEPSSFGQTAYMRSDLLRPYHINQYLNLINGAPNAVILSSDFKAKNINVGDKITLNCKGQGNLECVVYAFVDYWPGYIKTTYDSQGTATHHSLAILNIDTLQKVFPFDGYEIWFKRSADSDITKLTNDIKGAVDVTNILWTSQNIVKLKNDPMLQGINGMLTLVFIITMLISMIGFLIYWILSIHSRTLQFGIFRAMGIRLKSIIGMIISEQILISACAIFVGLVLGIITSDLFVPLFDSVTRIESQVLPFRPFFERGDYLKIYAIIGIMLVSATLVLTRMISSMKMDQALKLGED